MPKNTLHLLLPALCFAFSLSWVSAQQSVARQWNEVLLQDIREDFARPPVHARNLFHVSMAMYDAWAAYDSIADTYLLGKTVSGYTCPFTGVPVPADIEAAQKEALSFAALRVLQSRFSFFSPNAGAAYVRANNLMFQLGYNPNNTSIDYQNGGPAELGNYIGQCIVQMGFLDGSNEGNNYAPLFYQPVNFPLVMNAPGSSNIIDPNHWQPLQLLTAIDQNGNPIPSIQRFQSPEWGSVTPFALTAADKAVYTRNGHDYTVYHDPGPFPTIDTANGGGLSDEYKWNFSLVSIWASHNAPDDTTIWDISPRSLGNNQSYPTTLAGYHTFYNLEEGGDNSPGRPTNPRTGMPYAPEFVPRGDYTRVLAQFWADGPNSETPPGHWFSILNRVNDNPLLVKKFQGKGPVLSDLEWDIKAYFVLGGSVHDAAVTCWGIKGWYDGVRPVSALRYMAEKGQSTDSQLPHYSPAGIPLKPGFVELVLAGDPLAGASNENINKIKLFTWRGPQYVLNPATDIAGVGWILAENWWPYQRATFVTPPFGGYVSGHSTYSRAAAEALTLLTGDEYFPGGMGEYHIAANSGFLGLEKGPSQDVTLQWATYRDASDQCSLSRIWGGIHPPMDDIPARLIGAEIGVASFAKAETYFYQDADGDGYISLDDCNDHDASVYPGAAELCDNLDNDCNGSIDENIATFTFFADADGDGYGTSTAPSLLTCQSVAPVGYSENDLDCDDSNATINPSAVEVCDLIDNDCNGSIDDNLTLNSYYVDADGDGFGVTSAANVQSCQITAPAGYVGNALDCDDTDAAINPNVVETCDLIDNDCNGLVDDNLTLNTYYADADGDGFGSATAVSVNICQIVAPAGYVSNALDCNDADAAIHPGVAETCDAIDNDCNGLVDDAITFYTYFLDADGDGYGAADAIMSSCEETAPAGFSVNDLDCDDTDLTIHPGATEICDAVDNNCNGATDEGLATYTYYVDGDGDGYGSTGTVTLESCLAAAPVGYSINSIDCNDGNATVYPGAVELADGLDNNCDGFIDSVVGTSAPLLYIQVYPNPVQHQLTVSSTFESRLDARIVNAFGQVIYAEQLQLTQHLATIDFRALTPGVYFLHLSALSGRSSAILRIVKME